MVEGRHREVLQGGSCLLEQAFVKDGGQVSVKGLMAEAAKATGANLDVVQLRPLSRRGEGLEKKRQDDLAAESRRADWLEGSKHTVTGEERSEKPFLPFSGAKNDRGGTHATGVLHYKLGGAQALAP